MKTLGDNSQPAQRGIAEIALMIVDHISAMTAYWDANQICLFANSAYREWFGKSREQLLGISMKDLLGPLYVKNLPHIEAALRGENQLFEREIPLPDGTVRHSLATYTPHVVDGVIRGFFVHVADVTQLKKLEEELKAAKEEAEKLATHDFLTGLPNRILIKDRISTAILQAKRRQLAVAVMSMDLDDFKNINDRYGHSGGDKVLVEIAHRARHAIREADTIARLGGDEFVLVCPEVRSTGEVTDLVARILNAVRQPLKAGDDTIVPTCSLGVALYPGSGSTPEELMLSSDHALYEAKKLGKNGFAIAAEAAIGIDRKITR